MMLPFPEPAGDIRAQLAAMMSDEHPKLACFVVPLDAAQIPGALRAYIEVRAEGVLITRDRDRADAFRAAPHDNADAFDRTMAAILGYPEAKPDVLAACAGRPISDARAVQARTADGYVVTEAFCSPAGLKLTQTEIGKHVPPGGQLCVLTTVEAIGRRLMLREQEIANG
jgi:hypothetical protein